ncbi:MAG: hypothetical protein WD096_06950 [Actinomycetota bacterium]
MDETFAFIAPVMPRRAVNPLAVRAGVIAAVFMAVVGALGVYVVEHEQAADAHRVALAAKVAAVEEARVEEAAAGANVPAGMSDELLGAARNAADEAAGYAQGVLAAHGSLIGAGPAFLSTLGSPLLFVDGPSTAPTIVSVATTDTMWAAAVASPGGCAWIMLAADGSIARDSGRECTGEAALAATGSEW